MKNKNLFDHTVKILVAAYLNNALVHGNCHACAVGNIIAANLDIKYDKDLKWVGRQVAWSAVFVTLQYQISQVRRPRAYSGEAQAQIDATGYTWQELASIEYAFERARGNTPEAHTFNGLLAAIAALCQIHEMDANVESAVKQFVATAIPT